MSVWLVCDRCRQAIPVLANAMPPGWVRWPVGWPGDLDDCCEGCLTADERQALAAELVEEPR